MRTICLLWMMVAGGLSGADLTFEKTLLELNLAAEATTASVDFPFENKTDKPVTISRVDKTCSCLAAQVQGGKLTYQPGEQGVIRAVFDLGNFSGTVDKTVVLWLGGDPRDQPSVTLTVRVHVPVLVAMDQKTLKWSLDAAPTPQRIDIRINHSKPIRVLQVTSSSELFKVELKTLQEGAHYELWVTPLEMKQPGIAVIRIETDCEIARHKLQQVFAVVRRDLPGKGAATP